MQGFPEIVTFRITSRCNQNCRYCYSPQNIPELATEKTKKIFRLFYENGVKGVVLTGGEPLLRQDFKQLLLELKKYNLKIYLDTNGDLFFENKELIDQFVSVLGLPLDSINEGHSYRKNGNTEKILKILEYYKTAPYKPKIKIGTVITKENIHELPKIANTLKNYKIDAWKLYQFIPIGKTANLNKQELLIENELFQKEALAIQYEYRRFFDIIISPRIERARAHFLINPDGTVIMPTDNKITCRELRIGNVFEKDIVEKWQKSAIEKNYLDNAKPTFFHSWESLPIKPIYNKIWQLAKRYNQLGQNYTYDHIEWHIKEALPIVKSGFLDESIFMPFIILHDVGYSEVNRKNPFRSVTREKHMKAGRQISKKILKLARYPIDKIKTISDYVSIHDNWALDDHKIYRENKILGVFNDLDYISMLSKESFNSMSKFLKKDSLELLDHLENNEKLTNRPFVIKATQKLYNNYLSCKKQEISINLSK